MTGLTNPTARLSAIDDQLSRRPLALDPQGYFLIYLQPAEGLICAKHFSNVIDERGLACDPETGKPLPARGKLDRSAAAVFQGRTAKEVCVEIFERANPCPVSQLDHAAYLGRELVRAEIALVCGEPYCQD